MSFEIWNEGDFQHQNDSKLFIEKHLPARVSFPFHKAVALNFGNLPLYFMYQIW